MTLQERFDKFKKVFPQSPLDFNGWKKLTNWDTASCTLLRLDMRIFPDSLKTITWNEKPLNTVIFTPSQVKLTAIDFDNTNVNNITLPAELTNVKVVLLGNAPIVKIALGGSTAVVEELVATHVYKDRVALPAGMTSLKRLDIGSMTGGVILPKDAVNIEDLLVSAQVGEGKVKIPATYTSLEKLCVVGTFTGIAVPNAIESLQTFNVIANGNAIVLPRLSTVSKLHVTGPRLTEVTIPASYGPNLTILSIEGYTIDKVTLPKELGKLSDISLRVGEASSVLIPKSAGALVSVRIQADIVTIKPELNKLEGLCLLCNECKVEKGASAVNLESLTISNHADVDMTLPSVMPSLKALCVNSTKVPTTNVETPLLPVAPVVVAE